MKKTNQLPRTLFLISSLLLLALVWVFSLLPTVRSPLTFNYADKLIHFAAYAIMAFLAISAVTPQQRYRFISMFFFLFANGLLIEIIQPFTGRSFDWTDQAANTLGILTGLAVGRVIKRKS